MVVTAGDDLQWTDDPSAWHQQLARIVDHRFVSFARLQQFARDAKKAGVSALRTSCRSRRRQVRASHALLPVASL